MLSIKRAKKIIIELIINVVSFSILILSQQILALPIISKYYDVNNFGNIVLAFGISNILTSMFGFSIGNARLLDSKSYNSTYIKLLYTSNILVLLLGFFIYAYFFSGSPNDNLLFSLICLLGNIRFFIISEFRIKNIHNWIFTQNIFYFIGVLFGLLYFSFVNNWLIVFLSAEVVSVAISFYYLYKNDFLRKFDDYSKLPLTNTVQLIINNGASYTLSQYDRFIIYPILGASNLSLYYSASVSSKIGALTMNPLSNFVLGKLARKKEDSAKKIINFMIVCSFLVIIVYFIISIITTPILVNFLYPSYYSKIKHVFIPICLAASILGGVNILKPIVMKYQSVKYYNKIFFVYGILLILISIFLCLEYGLIGVAVGQMISSFIFWLTLLTKLIMKSNEFSVEHEK